MKLTFLGHVALCLLMLGPVASRADVPEPAVRQLWQLSDYVGVDYSGAVSNGTVVSAAEYAEMDEFASRALEQAKQLPDAAGKAELLTAAQRLREAVTRKEDPKLVAELARRAAGLLLTAYPVPVAPRKLPEIRLGQTLYQAQCASCHGAAGNGDGPLAPNLDPKPIAFTDHERAATRSLMALYQVVSQGVPGTSMPAFTTLSDDDRWALAWYVGTMANDDASRQRGAALWQSDARAKARMANLAELTTQTQESLASAMGANDARDLMAYLRSDSAALATANGGIAWLARSSRKVSRLPAPATRLRQPGSACRPIWTGSNPWSPSCQRATKL